MATYKEIKGVTVQALDADPVENVGTWASGAAANTGRSEVASAGTSTANMISGGEPPITGATEQWNGTAWTEVADLNQTRYGLMGAGTTTAVVSFGGADPGNNRIGNI